MLRPASSVRCLLAASALVTAIVPVALAQDTTRSATDRRGELARLEDEIKLSDEVVSRLQGQIKALDADRTKLSADLVATATRTRAVESQVSATELRLATLTTNETAIKASLKARQGVLVEVIASLQRMGHHPPPALLVRPEDALVAVRTAMLLGSVLPGMREETRALAGDLAELSRVRGEITLERNRLLADLTALAEDRKRIDLLVEERRRVIAQQERSLVSEQVRAAALAKEASNLRDLIARLESEVGQARRAAEAAQAADANDRQRPPLRPSLAALEDPSRLAPAFPFEKAKGLLSQPVEGEMRRQFGDSDGNGGVEKGLSLATHASAMVIAPCDGWVVYAGPFRSYGQLLIINAGGGYHVVLAGMERINVGLGQFVLTGEPVGAMGAGETRIASSAPTAATLPILYVEFRKDGVSIDPTPWWTKQGEKARG
jgi:septal ring factor EnvC (AmiA/AmiB activator)